MGLRDHLTNEGLRGIFRNNFELTNYVIGLGRHYVKAGHEISVDQLLEQVRKNPHAVDWKKEEMEEEEREAAQKDEGAAK